MKPRLRRHHEGGGRRAMAQRFYSEEELASVPVAAVEWAGVGNPVRQAHPAAGEVVLDSSRGDRHRAGCPPGRALLHGHRSRHARRDGRAGECGGARGGRGGMVRPPSGDMEAVPLPDATVDVVISNGVINLSARRSRGEANQRVLRPGGRGYVADLVDDDLPPEVCHRGQRVGCISRVLCPSGCSSASSNVPGSSTSTWARASLTLDDVALYPLFTPDVLSLMRRLVSNDAQQHTCTSLIARARQPASHTRRSPAAGAWRRSCGSWTTSAGRRTSTASRSAC